MMYFLDTRSSPDNIVHEKWTDNEFHLLGRAVFKDCECEVILMDN